MTLSDCELILVLFGAFSGEPAGRATAAIDQPGAQGCERLRTARRRHWFALLPSAAFQLTVARFSVRCSELGLKKTSAELEFLLSKYTLSGRQWTKVIADLCCNCSRLLARVNGRRKTICAAKSSRTSSVACSVSSTRRSASSRRRTRRRLAMLLKHARAQSASVARVTRFLTGACPRRCRSVVLEAGEKCATCWNALLPVRLFVGIPLLLGSFVPCACLAVADSTRGPLASVDADCDLYDVVHDRQDPALGCQPLLPRFRYPKMLSTLCSAVIRAATRWRSRKFSTRSTKCSNISPKCAASADRCSSRAPHSLTAA